MAENKYIRIDESVTDYDNRKTFTIENKRHNEQIGWIEYYSCWNQYVFCPMKGTVWNNECLEFVKEFLDTLK